MTELSPPRQTSALTLSRRITVSSVLLLIGMVILLWPILHLTDAEALTLANMGVLQTFAWSYGLLTTEALWAIPFILGAIVILALHTPNRSEPPAA